MHVLDSEVRVPALTKPVSPLAWLPAKAQPASESETGSPQ